MRKTRLTGITKAKSHSPWVERAILGGASGSVMLCHLAVGLVALLVLGCEPMSEYARGREDVVRYQLPRGAMEIFENADTIEVFAIADPDPSGGSNPQAYFDRIDEVAVARAELAPREFPLVIRSTYESISGGRGAALCYIPHHAVRARRGTETLEFSVCLMCLQMRIAAADRYIAVDPWPIVDALNRLLEEHSGIHFDPQALEWTDEAGTPDLQE